MSGLTLEQGQKRINNAVAKLAEAQAILMLMSSVEHRQYVDDHNRGDRIQSLENWVLVEHNNQLCPFPVKGMGACLNPLYLAEDGKVHLSTWSIGPYYSSVQALDEAGIKYYII